MSMVHPVTSKHVPATSARRAQREKTATHARAQTQTAEGKSRKAGPAVPNAQEPYAVAPERARQPSEAEQRRMIEEAAYFLAERRRFATGFELEDWVAAEQEISLMLRGKAT
jgi:hypothetical protein